MIASVLWWGIVLFLGVKAVGLAVNLVRFPRLSSATLVPGRGREVWDGAAETLAHVSILVPVRNEERTLPLTLPGLLRQPVGEIVLLDDGSEDETFDLATRLTAGHPHARVLRGESLPEGWIGKNWACSRLAEAAQGDLLIFLDADVHLEDGAAEAIVAEMRRQTADAFSVFPRHLTGSLAERALLPIIDHVLLSFLPFPLLREPRARAAAVANGQVFAFDRSTYDALGGHASVRGEILEDVLLARRVRREGFRLGLALGGDLVAVRMYRSYPAMIHGLGKSLLAAHGESRLLMLLSWTWHAVAYTLPLLLVATEPRWALPLVAGLLERVAVNVATGRGAYGEALLMPLVPLLALPVHVRALARRRVWKGRSYG